MNKTTKTRGFKVTNPDFTSNNSDIKWEVGKTYIHKGDLKICKSGFHFCKQAQHCFNYYEFDPKNHVFEVEAYGEIIDEGDKSVCNNIELIREIEWAEVLIIANSGMNNAGHSNIGNRNSGNCNIGNWNSGDRNNGDRNNGDWNSGNSNIGNRNIGNCNSGDWNSGNCNSGNSNIGNRNIGNCNSGNWNSGNRNSGDLNTTDGQWRCFNKEQKSKRTDHYFPSWLYFNVIVWKGEYDMTEDEKIKYPYYKTTGGCLIVKDYKQAAQESYNKATKFEQDAIEKLPDYDPDVLFELFGIDRRIKELSK